MNCVDNVCRGTGCGAWQGRGMAEVSRRSLLTGARKAPAFRPPWSGSESDFTQRCSRCHACLDACETGVLQVGAGGFPHLDFTRAECTFCYGCAGACPESLFTARSAAPWEYQLTVSAACLAFRQTECRCCQDACPEQAIRFFPVLTGIAVPQPESARCTTCGACLRACPVSALSLRNPDER